MLKNKIIDIFILITIFFSTSSFAYLADNGLYTTDTISGLDWLDVTETVGSSYDTISGQLEVGGAYEGWRYASRSEVNTLFINESGINRSVGTYSADGENTYDNIVELLGDTLDTFYQFVISISYCDDNPGTCIDGGYKQTFGITSDSFGSSFHYLSVFNIDDRILTNPDFLLDDGLYTDSSTGGYYGSFLVRNTSFVPLPASIWLLGTSLLGLLGLRTYKS